MIQEIAAILIFVLAIVYTLYQAGRIIVPAKRKSQPGCSGNACKCSTPTKKLIR